MLTKNPAIADLLRQQVHDSLSPLEAIQQQAARAEQLNTQYHCLSNEFTTFAPKAGPLTGIGLIHKDIFALDQFAPGFGITTPIHQEGINNAPVIQRLADAGAVCLATAVMAPYACGASAQNANFPRCINPVNEEYVVGGSSSGSAVAVASGMTPISLGTDTTGSVRIPAASCGIFGLKTTRGLLSTEGVRKLAPTLDSVGLLSSHLEDMELLLPLLTQQDLEPIKDTVESLHIGLWLPSCVDSTIRESITVHLAGKVSVEAMEIHEFDQLKEYTDQLLAYEANQLYADDLGLATCPRTLKTICKQGKLITTASYEQILADQSTICSTFVQRYFSSYDVLLVPTFTCSLPNWQEVEIGHPAFDKDKLIGLFQFMGFVNYLGLPSLSIPIGADARGRPLSIQALGAPRTEASLLAFARRIYAPYLAK